MKKIQNILENCKECSACQRFNPQRGGIGSAFICGRTQRLITVASSPYQFEFPDWCPLETYKETAAAESAVPGCSLPSTVVLPGMPGLEWMTENLKGLGGTEIDGRTYYTHPEALEAVRQLGNGWRLPTFEEFEALAKLESKWQDGPQGLPGRLFEDRLFLEAAGYRGRASGDLTSVGGSGNYWSSSSYAAGNVYAGYLNFTAGSVSPLNSTYRAGGLSVRCVRNLK